MIKLADILRDHQTDFMDTYGQRIQTVHHRTIEHILTCRHTVPSAPYENLSVVGKEKPG